LADTSTRIAGHWQWVLLLIILFLAFVIGLTVGFWLKRRHRRRRELRLAGGVGHNGRASPSPFASGSMPYVGTAGNHPQMTVVPGAGSEAAMARYDGSGVGSRPVSMTPHEAAAAAAAGYGHHSNRDAERSRDFAVPSPPPLAGMRQDSANSSESRRKKMRHSLRPMPEDGGADDIEPVGVPSRRSGDEEKGASKLVNKLKRGVGVSS
jgi:hypothetical protein